MLSKELEVTLFVTGEATQISRSGDDCPTSPANTDETRGGAGGGDKVITTGRSKWDSAQAYLVREHSNIISAPVHSTAVDHVDRVYFSPWNRGGCIAIK